MKRINFTIGLYLMGMFLDIISSIMVIDGVNVIETNFLLSSINSGNYFIFILVYLIIHLTLLFSLVYFYKIFKNYDDKFYLNFEYAILFLGVYLIIMSFKNVLIGM